MYLTWTLRAYVEAETPSHGGALGRPSTPHPKLVSSASMPPPELQHPPRSPNVVLPDGAFHALAPELRRPPLDRCLALHPHEAGAFLGGPTCLDGGAEASDPFGRQSGEATREAVLNLLLNRAFVSFYGSCIITSC